MNYTLKIGESVVSVEAGRPDDTGSCLVDMGDNPQSVTVRALTSDELRVQTAGSSFMFYVRRDEASAWIWCNGRARQVQDASTGQRRMARGPVQPPDQVTSPTPAAVVRVLVSTGDEVTRGQGLVVVSAMKMEMTLAAPYDGTVTAVNTEVGAQVSPADILVIIEPRAQEASHEPA